MDYLSRQPLVSEDICYHIAAEEFVRSIVVGVVPPALTAREVEQASEKDVELSTVRQCIIQNEWLDLPAAYRNVKQGLFVFGQLVLRGSRIVIPSSQRAQALALAHQGHFGIAKMKMRLCECVWWPGMDGDIASTVESRYLARH